MTKEEIIQKLTRVEHDLDQMTKGTRYASVLNYDGLVRKTVQEDRKITIWSEAIEKALAEAGSVYFPAAKEPYFIDRPIILDSNMHIKADPGAVIRAVEGMETCMVRNRHLEVIQEIPAPKKDFVHDVNMSVSGGIWDHAKFKRNHKKCREAVDSKIPYAEGMFLFLNVANIAFTDLTMMRSPAYAFLFANGENLLVRNILFDECHTDGPHVEGPFQNIIIKNLTGQTGDDFFTLNSWCDEVCYGPVDCAWVSNLKMIGGFRGMRLTSSTGRNNGGYPLTNIVVEHVSGTRDFKMIPCTTQATLQSFRKLDHAGFMDWIYIEDIEFLEHWQTNNRQFNFNGCVQLHSNVGRIFFKDLRGPAPHIKVGPYGLPDDSSESYNLLYQNDYDCVVEHMELSDFADKTQDEIVWCVSGEKGRGIIKELEYPLTIHT